MKYSSEQVRKSFESIFNSRADFLVQSPGRINLIGEHTDYNDGFVMPAAIDRYIYLAFANNNSNQINLSALDINETFSLGVSQLKKTDKLWVNYILGLILELKKRNIEIKGFDCCFGGNLAIGSGMSSSAALECGFIFGLNKMFELQLSNWEMIEISKASNHDFLGIKGGIMDQFSIINGKKDHFLLLDCLHRSHEEIYFDAEDYSFLLINSMIKHDTSAAGYSNITSEFREILNKINSKNNDIQSFRDIESQDDIDNLYFLSDTQRKKLSYLFSENQRVMKCKDHLERGAIVQLEEMLNASHYGLSNHLKVSLAPIEIMIDWAKNRNDIYGSRIMGAGFGGCILNLIKTSELAKITNAIQDELNPLLGVSLESYHVNLSDGIKCL